MSGYKPSRCFFNPPEGRFVLCTSRKDKKELRSLFPSGKNDHIFVDGSEFIYLYGLDDSSSMVLIKSLIDGAGLVNDFLSPEVKRKICKETRGQPCYIKLIIMELVDLWEDDYEITKLEDKHLTYTIAITAAEMMDSLFGFPLDQKRDYKYQSLKIENIIRHIIFNTSSDGSTDNKVIKKACCKFDKSPNSTSNKEKKEIYEEKIKLLKNRGLIEMKGDRIQGKPPMIFRKVAIFNKNKPFTDFKKELSSKECEYLELQITNVSSNNFFIDIDDCYDDLRKTFSEHSFNKLFDYIPNYSSCLNPKKQ